MIQKSFLLSAKAIGLLAVVAGCDTMRVGTGGMGGFGHGGAPILAGCSRPGAKECSMRRHCPEKDEDTIGQSVAVSLTSTLSTGPQRTALNDRDHFAKICEPGGVNGGQHTHPPRPMSHWIFRRD